jgi:hypothetical protein
MSDEQIQAQRGCDPEPYRNPLTGYRCTNPNPGREGRWILDARHEFIPAPDPLPMVHQGPWGESIESSRMPIDADVWAKKFFRPRPWGTFTPDPEFVRSEVNPILSAFRDEHDESTDIDSWIEFLAEDWERDATPEQVVSARVILERLARLTA